MDTQRRDNLERPRPHLWDDGTLFPFIEECWGNTVATFANKTLACQRLTAIDGVFEDLQRDFKPTSIEQLVPVFLFLRSMVAFRASVLVGTCLPTESYCLTRLSLECAGYGLFTSSSVQLATQWFKRDDSERSRAEFRKQFTHGAVCKAIEAKDVGLASVYRRLYERSIDFGAHPNEKAVTANLLQDGPDTRTIRMMVSGAGNHNRGMDHALRTFAQTGVCVLKIFRLVFLEEFAKIDGERRVEEVARTL